MTAAQLASMREREQREMQQLAEQQAAEGKRVVSEEAYAAALEVENRNRCVFLFDCGPPPQSHPP